MAEAVQGQEIDLQYMSIEQLNALKSQHEEVGPQRRDFSFQS
jgi:hypothetical protein